MLFFLFPSLSTLTKVVRQFEAHLLREKHSNSPAERQEVLWLLRVSAA